METLILKIDNTPNIQFVGELIASAASSDNRAMGRRYSGEVGCWTELDLYKTKSGAFVCHKVDYTCLQGERDSFAGKVCKTLEEVREFFGHNWLAKELYDKAGIDDVIEAD